jgi:hypothetical protein
MGRSIVMRRGVTALAKLVLVLVVSCGSRGSARVPTQRERPETLGAPCAGGRSACAAPLVCLAVPPETQERLAASDRARGYESICTMACASDAECPSWPLDGDVAEHCGPIMQSPCVNGQCQYAACK